jgi:hypothetical protein
MYQTAPPQPQWHFTHHFRQRAAELGITQPEAYAVLDDPEVVYDQPGYGPTRQVRQRGRLGIVVDSATGAVITVVFRSHQLWLAQLPERAA